MEVIIKGSVDEIAALVLAVQRRQWGQKELEARLTAILKEQSKAHSGLQYT